MSKNRASWGGARRGAGRKHRQKNRRTIARDSAARLLPYCADPLAWLLGLMNDARQDVRLRADAARALMPYFHAVQRKDGLGQIDTNEDNRKSHT